MCLLRLAMDCCPICRCEVTIQPPDWSGGRMLVECASCGAYEIGPKVYDELAALPKSHWQIDRLREGLERANQPVKIAKASTNIIEVEPLGQKMTKMQKWSLRKRAEKGESKTVGRIFNVRESD